MNEFEDRLRRSIQGAATEIQLPGAGERAVMAKARKRQARQRGVVAAGCVVALAAGGFVVADRLNHGDGTTVAPADSVAADTTLPAAVTGPATLVPATSSWRRAVPSSALGWNASVATKGSGGFIALSTAPGKSDQYAPSMYRSDDGIDWTQTSMPEGFVVQYVGQGAGRFLVTGTAANAASVDGTGGAQGNGIYDVKVATSTDGSGWTTTKLPIDVASLKADGIRVGVRSTAATNGDTTVVASIFSGWIERLPNSDPPSNFEWYSTTADGVQVMVTPQSCIDAKTAAASEPGAAEGLKVEAGTESEACNPVVSETIPWAQTGFTAEQQSALRGEVEFFVTKDGTTFSAVTVPESLAGSGAVQLVNDGAGFVAVVSGAPDGSFKVLRSADGTHWSADAGSTTGWVQAAGVVNGRLTLIVNMNPLTGIMVQNADGTWTTTSLQPVTGETADGSIFVTGAVVNDKGIVMTLGQYGSNQPSWQILESADGVHWSSTSADELAGEHITQLNAIAADGDNVTISAATARRQGSGSADEPMVRVALVRTKA